MRLDRQQKKAALRLAESVLRPLYFFYRLLTGEQFADHRLPASGGPEPERILVVRLDSIGDVLLSEPAIAALRERFPRARLDVVVAPEGQAILANNPSIDSLVLCKVPWHSAWRGERVGWEAALRDINAVAGRLRAQNYDLSLELRGDARDILFTVLAGARVRVGNGFRGGGFLLDHDVVLDESLHRVDFGRDLAAAAGASKAPRSPRLYVTEADRVAALSLLPDTSRYVGIHLGAGFPSKCLPVEKFADVAHALAGDGLRPVVLGGPGERSLAERFVSLGPSSTIDAVGKLSLLELAAALERCSVFIGNDSGPMHIAGAMGTPVVAAFGPSDPLVFGPCGVEHRIIEVDMACRPCDLVHCTNAENLCMTSIKTDDIIVAARELLAVSERDTVSPEDRISL